MDSSASIDQKDKVAVILTQVSELTESERHMLYSKLSDVHDESSKDPPTSMSRRTDLALSWIRAHYVEDRSICVPKQDVYEQYRQHCEASGNNPLSSFDFGKMMKHVFPNIHHRRLGQRGKSIYCYGGLRAKESIDSSSPNEILPSVQSEEDEHQRLYNLSCQLVCEWATQLLGRPFADIRNLSEYLVSKGLSCGKTAAKFTVLSGSTSPPKLLDREKKSPNSKHHDRQLLVQRKLQHNELIREHKEKLKQLQEQQSAGAGCPKSPFSLGTYPAKSDEQISTLLPGTPVRKILPRPLSVQPYVRCGSATGVSIKKDGVGLFPYGLGSKRAALSELNKILIGESTAFGGQASSVGVTPVALSSDMREPHAVLVQPKRCHSTSVVEKQSSSLSCSMLEMTGRTLGTCSGSAYTNSGNQVDEGSISSFHKLCEKTCLPSVNHLVSSSSLSAPEGTCSLTTAYPTVSAYCSVKSLVYPTLRASTEGLLTPQHPKRYGDNISPDRGSLIKRKCTTSLGVTKQQSLEASMVESEGLDSEMIRTRPYSCPVSCAVAMSCDGVLKEGKSLADHLLSCLTGKKKLTASEEKTAWKMTSQATEAASPTTMLTDNVIDEKNRELTQKQSPKTTVTLCHVVQKPTVINRPTSILHSVASCPDFKQAVAQEDATIQPQESTAEKQPYNILNSLLSSDCGRMSDTLTSVKSLQTPPHSDTLTSVKSVKSLSIPPHSDTLSSVKSLPIPPNSSPIASPYFNTLPAEPSKLGLHSSPLRLMTNPTHTVENPGILSSLSSRSAFVPVTSHKLQVSNSASKEGEALMGVVSAQAQPMTLPKKDGGEIHSSSAETGSQPSESGKISAGHTLVKPVMANPYAQTNDHAEMKDVRFTAKLKFKKCVITVPSNSSSSSSSSSSSTLCRSGESTSSGCESLLTTPIPAPSAAAEKLEESSQVSLPAAPSQSSPSDSSNCSPATQYKPSLSISCTTGAVPLHHISPSSHSLQTRTATTSPITPPKRASRNRFTPIRPKLGGGANTPSPHKLGGTTTPSPQKKDMRPVSTILKEQRVKCAQDLLMNLASNYQGEVQLQMPAEFLGFSPTGKHKSADVRVTIRSPSNTSITPPHKEITVIVEPVSHQPDSQSTTSPALSSCLIPATPTQLLQNFPQPLGVHVVPQALCPNSVLPKPLFSPTFQDRPNNVVTNLSPTGSNTQVILIPPSAASLPIPQNVAHSSSKPIIVEDDKGNKYSLDQKSGYTVLPQNMQQLIKTNQPADSVGTLVPGTTFSNGAPVLVNVSTIKGHVVGPDANGQTYLLVPNSEPAISTTAAPPGFVCQQMSPQPASAPTPTVTRSHITSHADFSTVSTVAQPHVLPSEIALLTNNDVKNKSAQALIKHNSSSSAFHKCPSSIQRRSETTSSASEVDFNRLEKIKDVFISQNFNCATGEENVLPDVFPTESSKLVESTEQTDVINDSSACGAVLIPSNSQGVRKRKASKSQEDEPENRKRLNSSRGQNVEEDDDVFIVKIEESFAVKSTGENLKTAATSKLSFCEHPPSKSPSECDSGTPSILETESKIELTDTEALLKMLDNSKSMTVKETIKALNELRARQNQTMSKSLDVADSSLYKDRPVLRETLSCQDVKVPSHDIKFKDHHKQEIRGSAMGRSHSVRCCSISPHQSSDTQHYTAHQDAVTDTHSDISKVQRTGRRHISLNLESLESDALLDTEPALDHKLVGDITDVASRKLDQKTSVGVAAKSARSVGMLLSVDKNSDFKFHLKQHKRDKASEIVTLNDKKHRDKAFSCVLQKEKSQPCVLDGRSDSHKTTTSQDAVIDNPAKLSPALEKRRSLSCVCDILPCDTKLDASEGLTTDVSKVKDCKVSQSLTTGSKASEHPFLAQFLSKPSGNFLDVRTCPDNQAIPSFISLENSTAISSVHNDADILVNKSNVAENELPVDIADFITESMSVRNSFGCDAFKGNTLSTLLADLVRNGQNDREQACASGEHVSIWRSMSVPNTFPDICVGFKAKSKQDDHGTSSKNYPPTHARSRSVVDCVSGFDNTEQQTCMISSSSLPLSLTLEGLDNSYQTAHPQLNSESVKEKEISLEHLPHALDSGHPAPSGTFLSPIGPVKLTRRSSVERSVPGDRSMTKTPVECSNTERSRPRMRTPVDRNITKTPVDRNITKTPVDRNITKTPVDRNITKTPVDRNITKTPVDRNITKFPADRNITKTPVDRNITKTPVDRLLTKTPVDRPMNKTPIERHSRRAGRDKSPIEIDSFSNDFITGTTVHQSMLDRESHKNPRVVPSLSSERIFSDLQCDGLFSQGPEDGLTHQASFDSAREERPFNQTPMSDAGYSSVSQTPISDVGCNSVSPSPIMMSMPGLFGECGRRDLASPATIFMPLRSDSAMSAPNSGRNCDISDNLQTLVAYSRPQAGCIISSSGDVRSLNRIREDENYFKNETESSIFCQDVISSDSSFLQNAVDGTMLDADAIKDNADSSLKRTSEDHILKQMLDFEKFMSAQLNCIPTPPRSPSTSPQHPADINPSPLSFNVASSLVLPAHSHQDWVAPASSLTSHHLSQFSSVITTSAHVASLPSNSLHVFSPGGSACSDIHRSGTIIPHSPYSTAHSCSPPHQYNPHPSPPFTPSSQKCLASPRCRTPCSHRSLMSPSCATPSGDLSSAPNRFMPIQTSGILATSSAPSQTYIQPIRPVVTLASAANNRSHTSLVFSHSEETSTKFPQNKACPGLQPGSLSSVLYQSSTLYKPDTIHTDLTASFENPKITLKHAEDDIVYLHSKASVREKASEDHKPERSSHPALILSLTGSIGSVSGQGMKSGWRKGISGQVFPAAAAGKRRHNSGASTCLPLLLDQCRRFSSEKPSSQDHSSEHLPEVSPAHREMSSQPSAEDVVSGLINIENPLSSASTGVENSRHSHQELTWAITEEDGPKILSDKENRYDQQQALSIHIDPPETNESLKLSLQEGKDPLLNPRAISMFPEHSGFPFSVQLAKLSGQSENVLYHQQQSQAKPNTTASFSASQQTQAKSNTAASFSSLQQTQAKPNTTASFSSLQQTQAKPNTTASFSSLQQTQAKPNTTASFSSSQQGFQDKYSTTTSSYSSLSAMLQAPAFDSSQSQKAGDNAGSMVHARHKPLQNICDLPTAYYAGTAPNVDLTKTPLALVCQTGTLPSQPPSGLQHSRSEAQLEAYLINLTSHLERRLGCTSGNQDDLGETLNVLKSLDSQYFQPEDDDSKSPETVI